MTDIDVRTKLPWRCAGCGAKPDEVEWANADSSYFEGHVVGGPMPDVCGPFVLESDRALRESHDALREALKTHGQLAGESGWHSTLCMGYTGKKCCPECIQSRAALAKAEALHA